ncbi:endonuclease domain-containing protein [Microbacterium sp. SLBN-111]|uniref:endonuclease domain-containing protein n=1 Tax=Microbacterium sp. SLBN-111 TaxID=3377733 RepID=UPI003C760A5B
MRRSPLPSSLGVAFDVASARRAGVSSNRLFARDLAAPFHGIRVHSDRDLGTLLERCHAYAPRLRGPQFFSQTTAAVVWDLPLPASATHDLHVSASPPAREPRTSGVIGHRILMDAADLTLRSGLPVPAAAETWAQLGGLVPRDALVAAADAILTRGDAALEDLRAAAERLRRRGAADLTTALELARRGADSPRETEVRLILQRAGLPEPELNSDLIDDGRFIARLDLAYRRYRVAVEYDGRQHASMEQFRRDADRWPAIANAGWILVRVLDHHLRNPERDVVAPVRTALISRGWRPGV